MRSIVSIRLAALLLALVPSGARGADDGAARPPPPPDAEVAAPRAGAPLRGLGAADLERFAAGRRAFERSHGIETGLGPVFNDSGCNRCHNRKGVGGAGLQVAVLAGRLEGGVFDPLSTQGGPTFATASVLLEPSASVRRAIPRCSLPRLGEPIPPEANVVTRRRTTPLFGLGLVDATPDAVFVALAARQRASIRGRAPLVPNLATGARSVGKFGWKAQAPTLHQFAGLALAVELGVTNPDFPSEQLPLGDAAALADCDAIAGLEDDGTEVQRLTDFMRWLAPVAPLPQGAEARRGDALFTSVGCDGCHVRRLTSGPDATAALSHQTYAPYSDFLLHDMGELGDGIGGEGDARPSEMRTAPLWGLHLSGTSRLLHDGRARSLDAAISGHGGQGSAAREAYQALGDAEQRALIAFLETL